MCFIVSPGPSCEADNLNQNAMFTGHLIMALRSENICIIFVASIKSNSI